MRKGRTGHLVEPLACSLIYTLAKSQQNWLPEDLFAKLVLSSSPSRALAYL